MSLESLATNRLLRLDAVAGVRSALGWLVRPADIAALLILVGVGSALAINGMSKLADHLGSSQPLLPALAAFLVADQGNRFIERRLSWHRRDGLLAYDALNGRISRQYRSAFHLAIFVPPCTLCVSACWVATDRIAVPITGYLLGYVLGCATSRWSVPIFANARGGRARRTPKATSPKLLGQIFVRQTRLPCNPLATSTILAAAGASSAALIGWAIAADSMRTALAVAILPALAAAFLTRRDADLARLSSLTGRSPAWTAGASLLPAFALIAGGLIASTAFVPLNGLGEVLAFAAGGTCFGAIALLRFLRLTHMSSRSADFVLALDLAIAGLLAFLAVPLGPAFVILRTLRAARQAQRQLWML